MGDDRHGVRLILAAEGPIAQASLLGIQHLHLGAAVAQANDPAEVAPLQRRRRCSIGPSPGLRHSSQALGFEGIWINFIEIRTVVGINPVVQHSAAVVASSRVRCGLPGRRIICAEFRPVGAAGLVVNESAERNGAQLLHRHRAGGGEIRRGVGGDGDHRLPQALGQNSALVYPHHAFIAGGPGDGLVLEGPGVNRCGQGVGRALKQSELVVTDGNPAGSLRRGDVALAGGDDVQAGSLHIHPGGRSGILTQVIIRIGLLSLASLQIEK